MTFSSPLPLSYLSRQQLSFQESSILDMQDEDGNTCLHHAVFARDKRILGILLG